MCAHASGRVRVAGKGPGAAAALQCVRQSEVCGSDRRGCCVLGPWQQGCVAEVKVSKRRRGGACVLRNQRAPVKQVGAAWFEGQGHVAVQLAEMLGSALLAEDVHVLCAWERCHAPL